MIKKAFTLIELIFIIVIMGILIAVIVPRVNSNKLDEAAIKLISDIRYTQHLAMVDDKFNKDSSNWFKERWKIVFKDNKYSIVAGNTNHYAKRAIDASEIKLIDLNKLYKINLSFSNCSILADGSVNLGFDNLGRTYVGDLDNRVNFYDYVLKDSCIIHLTKKSDSIDIYIEPETGYIHIK